MFNKIKTVLIMAGGTGGHVFPGLAVATQMRAAGITVHWLGTQKGLEAKLVPAADIPLHFISISGLRGKGWKDLVLAPWRLLVAMYQAQKILRHIKPDVVLGMGGFVSGPGGMSSFLLGYPLVIHEQNAQPGTTNKWLAKIAKKVLTGFPGTFPAEVQAVTVGNPVRTDILNLPDPTERFSKREERLHLLVVGGSLGAHAINALLPIALSAIPNELRPVVLHQTGEKNLAATIAAYEAAGVNADIKPFLTDMAKAYDFADIVLCRSGALTVAELCAVGLGAILVPFPYAVDDHQTANAKVMVNQEAAILIPQKDLTAEGLASLLTDLIRNRKKCVEMAQSAYKLRTMGAAEQVLTICQEIVT